MFPFVQKTRDNLDLECNEFVFFFNKVNSYNGKREDLNPRYHGHTRVKKY